MLAVVLHCVTQQASRTLKFVSPFWTRLLISSFLCWIKPESRFSAKSFSSALVQWLLSLQQRLKRYRGRGGMIMQDLSPFSFQDGQNVFDDFLEDAKWGGCHFPPRWYPLLLLNGSAVVPSNCSKRIALLPSMSKTKATLPLALSSTTSDNFLTAVGVQPGTL